MNGPTRVPPHSVALLPAGAVEFDEWIALHAWPNHGNAFMTHDSFPSINLIPLISRCDHDSIIDFIVLRKRLYLIYDNDKIAILLLYGMILWSYNLDYDESNDFFYIFYIFYILIILYLICTKPADDKSLSMYIN